MKKIILIASALFTSLTLFGQVGVNTEYPQGAFHVDATGNNTSSTATDGEQTDDVIVDSSGNVGIGTVPTAKLDVLGKGNQVFRLRNSEDTDSPLGKILTANSNGYGTWQTAGTSFAILGQLTTSSTSVDYYQASLTSTTDSNTNSTAYTGMFIDLPRGTYQINFTLWLSLSGSISTTGAQRFSSVFLSKSMSSSATTYRPTYTTGIKSVIMNSTYASAESDYYGSGAIPITVTADDITSYGAAHNGIDGTNISKVDGYVRYYLWVYVSASNFSSTTNAAARTRTQSPGYFGPYSQLYAIPFAISD